MGWLKRYWASFLRVLYRSLEWFWFRVLVLPALLLGAGIGMAEWLNSAGWLGMFDRASAVLGLSAIFAWPLAVYLWARRAEARLAYDVRPGISASEFRRKFKASLILVSREETSEWHIRHLQPVCVELVWTQKSDEVARKIIDAFENQVEILEKDMDRCLADAFDIEAVRVHCRRRLRALVESHGKENVCVDVTGGTAVMSLGAFQVAEELGATTIYLRGKTSDKNGNLIIQKPESPAEAEVVVLSNRAGKDFT